jgi:formate transporter
MLAGMAFSLALILIIVGGAELFTTNNLMVMAVVSGRLSLWELLRAWVIVYFGNLLGTMATVLMAILAGQAYRDADAIGNQAIAIATHMANSTEVEAFFRGVLGNVLVCLAIWLSYSGRSTTDRIIALTPPIIAYYAMGLEHAVVVRSPDCATQVIFRRLLSLGWCRHKPRLC